MWILSLEYRVSLRLLLQSSDIATEQIKYISHETALINVGHQLFLQLILQTLQQTVAPL